MDQERSVRDSLPPSGEPWWNRVGAPTLGFVGLGVFTVLTVLNLPLLVASVEFAWVVRIILVVGFVAGLVLATIKPSAARDLIDSPSA